MTPRNAAFLAFVGMLLLEALLIFGLIHDVISVTEGLIPALAVLKSLVYAFAGLTVVLFFHVFHKAQS